MSALAGIDKRLRAEGCRVELVKGWETRGHDGTLRPDGGLLHHTGGHNDLSTCVHGRADLAGPLCNLYVRRNGVVVVVAAGVAWHAGKGSRKVHEEVLAQLKPDPRASGDAGARHLADDWSGGNAAYVGVEVENTGSEPLTPEQLDVLPRLMAAVCLQLGKSSRVWRHHRQHTRRKVDMAYRGDLWALAQKRLDARTAAARRAANVATKPAPKPIPAPPARVLRLQHPYMSGPDVEWVQDKLHVEESEAGKRVYGGGTRNAVIRYQRANGMDDNGMVGSAVIAKLRAEP